MLRGKFIVTGNSTEKVNHKSPQAEIGCNIVPKFLQQILHIFSVILIEEIVLWRPLFFIALFVIVLWREFICVKIPQGEANKSANRWVNLRAKGGVIPPSVLHLPSSCAHQIYFFTRLAVYFLVSTVRYFTRFMLVEFVCVRSFVNFGL
jgi:hypothetical protein